MTRKASQDYRQRLKSEGGRVASVALSPASNRKLKRLSKAYGGVNKAVNKVIEDHPE